MEVAKYYTAIFRNYSPIVIVNGKGEKTGYMIQFLNVLKNLDNINVTTIPSTEPLWGAKVGNSWNGVLGMLERNIIVVLFGASLLIYLMGKLNSKYGKVKSELPWMFLLQCLLGTSPQSPKSKGVTRFLSVTWSLASFVLLVFVSSKMTSQFSSKSEALPFDTMDDIFHFPNANPLLRKSNAIFSFIQKMALTNPAFTEVTKRAEANPHSSYLNESALNNANIKRIEDRENFLIEVDNVQWNVIKSRYAKTGTCKLKLSKPIIVHYSVIYFKKHVSQTLIKTVNRRLRQLTEGDCFEDLNPSLKVESHPCQKTETPNTFIVINTQAFKAIFRVCIFGFSASFVALFLEIYVNTLKVHMCTS